MRYRRPRSLPTVRPIDEEGSRPAVAPITQLPAEAGHGLNHAILADMVLARLPDQDIPDTILYNGSITTFDDSIRNVDAIAVAGGLVIAAGIRSEVLKLAGSITDVINLGGRDWICWASPRCRGHAEAGWS